MFEAHVSLMGEAGEEPSFQVLVLGPKVADDLIVTHVLSEVSGRFKDALMAATVLQFRDVHRNHAGGWCGRRPSTPDNYPPDAILPYTTDFGFMRIVMDAMRAHACYRSLSLEHNPENGKGEEWACSWFMGETVYSGAGPTEMEAVYQCVLDYLCHMVHEPKGPHAVPVRPKDKEELVAAAG